MGRQACNIRVDLEVGKGFFGEIAKGVLSERRLDRSPFDVLFITVDSLFFLAFHLQYHQHLVDGEELRQEGRLDVDLFFSDAPLLHLDLIVAEYYFLELVESLGGERGSLKVFVRLAAETLFT